MALLPDWGRYLGSANAPMAASDTDPGSMEAFLAALRQFDPNARFQGEAISTGGGDSQQGWRLIYDNDKLPMNALGGRGIMGIADVNQNKAPLFSSSSVVNDPIFGRVTTPQNIKPQGRELIDIIGPLLVGGFAGLAGGGLGLVGNAMTKAPSVLNSFFGGGSTISPQQLLILRLLAMRNQMGGGGNG